MALSVLNSMRLFTLRWLIFCEMNFQKKKLQQKREGKIHTKSRMMPGKVMMGTGSPLYFSLDIFTCKETRRGR